MIKNPILRGFNPDPSIIRVDDCYYIATSTFEWFPGVQIHTSKDLSTWKLVSRALTRTSQLDMSGDPDSCGVWAPCLSYCDGTFYLIYSDVKSNRSGFLDVHNYLVTTRDILGEWSDPVYLNSAGFDPSLFHDDDGQKWLVGMSCDTGFEQNWFGGIYIQKYDHDEKALKGRMIRIFDGTGIGLTEGPHLYKMNGWYYLITAEGGTGLDHSVTVGRSKNIYGPYEVDPANPMLTSSDDPGNPLQKAGHADLVTVMKDELYIVHLCSRPLPGRGVCPLGRETAIQKICITDAGWLRLEKGGNHPYLEVAGPESDEHVYEKRQIRDDFNDQILSIDFQSLRIPLCEDMMSLTERPGYLRLKGMESLGSHNRQSLVARRQQSFICKAQTCIEFEPCNHKQTAGLICYYSTENFHYLYITNNEKYGKHISVMTCSKGVLHYPAEIPVRIDFLSKIYLRAEIDHESIIFSFSENEKDWIQIGPPLDAGILSDENASWYGFTGTFLGLCCQDLMGTRLPADFDYFEYEEF